MTDAVQLLEPLRRIHDDIRDSVAAATERQQPAELSSVSREDEGDTIYAIDAIGEDVLLASFEALSRKHSFVLIAEGLSGGPRVFPDGTPEPSARWRIIVDPIDGTRGLMYQKRSAWILTGVAPNRGPETSLGDVALGIQTEIPLVKQYLSDQAWAVRGQGARAERYNRLTGERAPLELRASGAGTIAHGFATLARFFPGARGELAAIDDEVIDAALGPGKPGKARCFEDQYISSGGQLYELMSGHDRFVADLRPLMKDMLEKRGHPAPLCCHPYDLCSSLIAAEQGIVLTDAAGHPLAAPLNLEADVAWVGYANERIRRQVEPLLQAALQRRGLLPC